MLSKTKTINTAHNLDVILIVQEIIDWRKLLKATSSICTSPFQKKFELNDN